MVTHKATLGETLFPRETNGTGHLYSSDAFFSYIWQADVISEIENRIFLLKRFPHGHGAHIGHPAFCIEKIFGGLINPRLAERIREWFPFASPHDEKKEFTKGVRESIGKLALEVFFETILDRNKKSFWEYLGRPDNRTWQEEPLSPMIYPTSLCVFLNYLASCNETTKHNQKNNIRKFLKNACDEPLEIDNNKIGIYHWTESARRILANALVANGMYEECLEYNLSAAYSPLVAKFLGSAFLEQEDGLVALYGAAPSPPTPERAMKKACENKEWAHIWSAITRMAFREEKATFIWTFDPTDPGIAKGYTNVPLKLAFCFRSDLTTGLNGF